MAVARLDHILAGPHGWIDLTIKASPKMAGYDPKKGCSVAVTSNGELMFAGGADLARFVDNPIPFGFRYAVPSGKSEAEVTIDGCVPKALSFALPLDLPENHLAHLVFDGSALVVASTEPFEPTSLEWVRGEIIKLHANNESAGDAVAGLTTIAKASLGLNLALLLIVAASAVIALRRSNKG